MKQYTYYPGWYLFWYDVRGSDGIMWEMLIVRLKGMILVYDIDDEIEIDGYEYCEVCMTLIYLCTIARW